MAPGQPGFQAVGSADEGSARRAYSTSSRGPRLRELAQRCTLRVGVDFATAAAEPLARALAGADAGAVAALVTELVRDVRRELSGHRVLPQRLADTLYSARTAPRHTRWLARVGAYPGPAARQGGQGGRERWSPSGPPTDVPLTISTAYRADVDEDTGSGRATADH